MSAPSPGSSHYAPGTSRLAADTPRLTLRVLAFGARRLATWHLAPGTGHRAPGTWHLAPKPCDLATWHLAPGTSNLATTHLTPTCSRLMSAEVLSNSCESGRERPGHYAHIRRVQTPPLVRTILKPPRDASQAPSLKPPRSACPSPTCASSPVPRFKASTLRSYTAGSTPGHSARDPLPVLSLAGFHRFHR